MEAPLDPDFPFATLGPPPNKSPGARASGRSPSPGRRRRTALRSVADDATNALGWTSLTILRGRRGARQPEDRRFCVPPFCTSARTPCAGPSGSSADEPFYLGVAGRLARRASGHSQSARPVVRILHPDVPGEVIVDFLFALDARDTRRAVRGARAAGPRRRHRARRLRDDQPEAGAIDPTFFMPHPRRGADPHPGRRPAPPGTRCGRGGTGRMAGVGGAGVRRAVPVRAASFNARVPHDLVAAFVPQLPPLRSCAGAAGEHTRDRLLRVPAG
ncbi:hypothetical protein ACRAWF_09555 [Streptomyces sp. L7]